MKRKLYIVSGILVLLLVSIALATSYVDSARVRNSIEPKCTIKIISDDGNKVTYWGLGYKVIRYPSVSPNEPYKNNRGAKYGSWFMKYELPTEENKQDGYDMVPMVMINDTLYLDSGYRKTNTHSFFDGTITSQVKASEKPSQNDQSNFGIGYVYRFGETKGTVEVCIDTQWLIFATEEVREELQFNK